MYLRCTRCSKQAIVVATPIIQHSLACTTDLNNVRLRTTRNVHLLITRPAGQTTWENLQPWKSHWLVRTPRSTYSNLPSIAPRGEPGVILPEPYCLKATRYDVSGSPICEHDLFAYIIRRTIRLSYILQNVHHYVDLYCAVAGTLPKVFPSRTSSLSPSTAERVSHCAQKDAPQQKQDVRDLHHHLHVKKLKLQSCTSKRPASMVRLAPN